MNTRKLIVAPIAAAVGTAFISSAAISADQDATLFGAIDLDQGYMIAGGDKDSEGSCGEGSCGGDDKEEGSCGEGSCGEEGEGHCGEDAGDHEGSCGEGSCGEEGEGSCGEEGEGSCGEGSCGGAV